MLQRRNIQFEVRLYHAPPQMHGFLVDRIALLWSMCDVVNGKGSMDRAHHIGASTPPIRRPASDHPARSFGHWFDRAWNKATVLPTADANPVP